jgi:hypothetical protein
MQRLHGATKETAALVARLEFSFVLHKPDLDHAEVGDFAGR